jgi:hypothetical protein
MPISGGVGGGSGLFAAYAYLRDERPTNTQGGDGTNGAYATRVLNTEVFDPDNIVTLAANQFTLGAGTYFITGRAPAVFTDHARVRIRNITDGATTGLGETDFSGSAGSGANANCTVSTRTTIAGAKVFELQMWIQTLGGFNIGFGTPANTGEVEVYAEVWIYLEG